MLDREHTVLEQLVRNERRAYVGAPHGRGYLWFVCLCVLLTSVPIMLVSMPPVMDYPNHLIRIWLLSGGAELPAVASVYIVDWSQASTNIGVDWVGAHAAQFLPLPVVDHLMRMGLFLGPSLGAIYLGRTLFGRWSAWHAAPLVFAWGTTSIAGFVNFSISLGAALLFAALQIRMKHRGPLALSAHGLFAVILLLIHPFGLLFYVALMAGVAVGRDVPPEFRFDWLRRTVKDVGILTIIGLAPLIALMLFSDAAPSANVLTYQGMAHFNPRTQITRLLSPILSYDGLTDVAFILPLGVIAAMITLRRGWGYHIGLLAIAACLGLLAVLAPNEIGDAAWIERRFPIMAALTLFAAIHPLAPGNWTRTALVGALLIAVVGKAGWITYVWATRDQDVEDLLVATQSLKPGDRVMPVKNLPAYGRRVPLGRLMTVTGDPVRAHIPTLLIKEYGAIVPTLFAVRGQQPIRVVGLARPREPKLSSYAPYAPNIDRPGAPGYIPDWRCSYDYVLLLGADEPMAEPLVAKGLTLVNAHGFAALYAINRSAQDTGCHQSDYGDQITIMPSE